MLKNALQKLLILFFKCLQHRQLKSSPVHNAKCSILIHIIRCINLRLTFLLFYQSLWHHYTDETSSVFGDLVNDSASYQGGCDHISHYAGTAWHTRSADQ